MSEVAINKDGSKYRSKVLMKVIMLNNLTLNYTVALNRKLADVLTANCEFHQTPTDRFVTYYDGFSFNATDVTDVAYNGDHINIEIAPQFEKEIDEYISLKNQFQDDIIILNHFLDRLFNLSAFEKYDNNLEVSKYLQNIEKVVKNINLEGFEHETQLIKNYYMRELVIGE